MLVYLALALVFGTLAYRWFHAWRQERGEIASLRRPVDPAVGLTPQATNQAVVMYVYGFPRQDLPGDHRDAVTARFGMTAPLLLERIDDLLAEATRLRDLHPGDALPDALAREHPILTPAAANALSSWARKQDTNPPA